MFFYGAGYDGNSRFFVTEYLARGCLYDILKSDIILSWPLRMRVSLGNVMMEITSLGLGEEKEKGRGGREYSVICGKIVQQVKER